METRLRKYMMGNHLKIGLGLAALLALGVGPGAASAEQLNEQQIQLIKDTAGSICNTVKDAKGQKTDIELEGDIRAQVNGLVGKLADLGGSVRGSLTHEEFEGLSRDATASALEGDRGCRERVFDKMFDRLVPNNRSVFIYNGPNSVIEGSSFSGINIEGDVSLLHNEGTFKNSVIKDVQESVDSTLPLGFGPRIHLDKAVIHQPRPSKTDQFGSFKVTRFLPRKKPDSTFISEAILEVPAPWVIHYLIVAVSGKELIDMALAKYARITYTMSAIGGTAKLLVNNAAGTIAVYVNTRTPDPIDIE